MAKRKVTICTGTACYILGGADILLLGEYLPDAIKNEVEIVGAPCLGICQDHSGRKPPYVKIDDAVMSEASVQKILEILLRDLDVHR